jgi:TonB family protein
VRELQLALFLSAEMCAICGNRAYADPTEPSTYTHEAAVAAKADSGGWDLQHWPPAYPEADRVWYPVKAIRLELEGRVLIGFDIGADGHTKNIAVIWSETPAFDSIAMEMLKETRFTVPANWARTGALTRWRAGIVFRLVPSCQSDQFAVPVTKILVTEPRLPGAHSTKCAS